MNPISILPQNREKPTMTGDGWPIPPGPSGQSGDPHDAQGAQASEANAATTSRCETVGI
jgi:hypothetical protein